MSSMAWAIDLGERQINLHHLILQYVQVPSLTNYYAAKQYVGQ